MDQNNTDHNAVLNLADDSVEVISVDPFPDKLIVHVRKKQRICYCNDCRNEPGRFGQSDSYRG